MSRLFAVLLLILAISASAAYADVAGQEPGEETITTPAPQTTQVQDAFDKNVDVTVTQSTPFNTQVLSGVAGPGEVDGGEFSTHLDSLEQGNHKDTHIQGGHDVDFNDDGTYSAASIDQLKQGLITIYNGVNVQWHNGLLSVDSAK